MAVIDGMPCIGGCGVLDPLGKEFREKWGYEEFLCGDCSFKRKPFREKIEFWSYLYRHRLAAMLVRVLLGKDSWVETR